MIYRTSFIGRSVLMAAILGIPMYAQAPGPSLTIDPNQHGNLAAAQSDIVDAYQRVSSAQQANDDHLGGHAANAKNFLMQADAELQAAASVADADQPPPPNNQPINASGQWTIYANDINDPGGSTKMVKIQQFGTQLSGRFNGPNQSGNITGFINGNHIEFSTKTRDVLTFRGQIQGNTMSGQYGLHGQHAAFNGVRSD
jgi:hypothetical protein